MPYHARLVRPTKSNPFVVTASTKRSEAGTARINGNSQDTAFEISEMKNLPCADSLETAIGKAHWHLARNKNTTEVRIAAPASRTSETDDYITEQQIIYTIRRQEQPAEVEVVV